jgi:Sulfatase-modifying factor enzyme 1
MTAQGPAHRVHATDQQDWAGLLNEIAARLHGMRESARESDQELLPPLLILGTSERVGSNWISDTLRPMMGQHNEPFRQQLAPDHPLSPLNPRPRNLAEGDLPIRGDLGWHWLVTFTASKYATTRQVVKEPNLFFAHPTVLDLLPGAPMVVLSRSPLGVASSFMRGNLFTRWGYRARYQQMIALTRRGDKYARRFAGLVPDDEPPDLVALARLQVLNTVLLADALHDRNPAYVSYETAVLAPDKALAVLACAVPELTDTELPMPIQGASGAVPRVSSVEDTFATTNSKTRLIAYLDPHSAELIRATTAASLTVAQAAVPSHVTATAASWLAGDHVYCLQAQGPRPAAPKFQARPQWPGAACYVRRSDLDVRNLLVTNAEYSAFLNAMAAARMPNIHGGVYLLACQMPHERGGRLHQDTATGRWEVSTGFEDHPVYWVTWIGAATFAAWTGARLPSRAELLRLTAESTAVNADYVSGDVTPVTEPGCGSGEIHHMLGNLQVWCCDGPSPAERSGGPPGRWLFGVAWNTPGTDEEAQRLRHRHILGCSRGVGIRLVRGNTQEPVPAADLAARLAGWISGLADRHRPLAELDERLIRALNASQADVRLGSHVTARARERGHG